MISGRRAPDDAPSSRIGTFPWACAALPLTVLASYLLLCVSGGSKSGLDACSVHNHPSPMESPEERGAWTAMPNRVSERRTAIGLACWGRRHSASWG